MTKKNLIASVIATALAMQTGVPYALAAEPISVTKSGDVLTVTGTQDITVYDSNANVINNQVTINNDGTVNVSALPKGSEKYYIKAGEDFYSFMNTYPELDDNFSTDKGWVFVRPHNMTEGSSTITGSIDFDPVNNGKVMKNVSEGGGGLFIPTQDYRQYDSKNSTIEVIEEVVSGTAGQEYPKTSSAAQIFVNMQEIYRPAEGAYENSNWKLSTKGYGVLVTWNNVIIRRYDGEYTNQYKAIDRTAPSADCQAGVAIYASRAADSAVTSPPIQADYTKYWRKIDTRYEDGKVIIDIAIAPVDTNNQPIDTLMWKGSYTDTNPVSTCGSFGVSRWFFSNPDWKIYSFKFTNNASDEVVKEDTIKNINANVTNVTKSGDSIDVSFDGEVTAFSTDKIKVLSASGAQQSVTKTFGDKKATIDLSTLNKNGTTYSLVISTVNGDNTYTFNMPAVWTADFTKAECGLHRYREDEGGNNFDTNGAKDAGVTSYTVSEFTSGDKTYNEAVINFGALHFSDDMRNLTPATRGNIEFNTHMDQCGVSPAVAYISDARQRADATEPYTGGDFQAQISGYLIYYYRGQTPHCVRFNGEQPTKADHDDKKLQKSITEEDGFTRPLNKNEDTNKIWGVKSSIEKVGNSVVITYQLTDQNGKTGTYTFTDTNPVSDKYLIGLASGMARAGESKISDLKIYYGDDTVTYVKNAKEEMTEWVEARKTATGRNSINMVTLGGSITQGAGWSGMLADYFSTQTGTTFTLINSGIGGTGSDLAAARLEKDVIEKQPDIVFLDHAVNDGSQKLLMHSQYMKTATNVEYIIRKLMTMENPPLIYMVDFTTEEILKNDLRMDANYANAEKAFKDGALEYDFNYGNYGGITRKKGDKVTDANDLYCFRKAYVGAADNAANFGNPAFYVRALPEDVYDYIAEYYNIPSINLHNFLKQYCSLNETVTEDREKNANGDYTMKVDYYALQNDYKSYATNNNDTAILDKYNGLAQDETNIQAILGDKVHSNELGKRLYGDYMIHLFETNPAYRFKQQTYNEKTLIGEDYAAVSGMKDVEISAYTIANNAKFSVTGDLTIKDSTNATFLSDGVTITNNSKTEGSITYTFKGRQFGALTNIPTGGTFKSITLDGEQYADRTMKAMFVKLNGLNHTYKITLEPGQSIELQRMFTDEDSIPNVGTAIAADNSSVVTLDITDYANAFVYRNTDVNDGDTYKYYGNTPWQKAHTHVETTQESVDWGLLSAQNIIKDLDGDNLWKPTGSTSVYDMSVLKRNSYYKAIRANLNKSLYVPEINTESVSLLTVPCFPGSNGEGVNAIKAKLVYSNGETQEVTFTPDEAITTLKRVNGNGTNGGTANLYEITVTADSNKKLSEIKFDGNSCKMLILGVSLKPLTTGSDKIAAYYEALSDTYGNVIGADASGKYDLATYKGQTVRYTADVLNLAAVSGSYTIRLALYNGGKLVNVVSSDCTVDEKGRINADITIPNDENQYSLKAFVWNAGKEMIPMKSAKVFEK